MLFFSTLSHSVWILGIGNEQLPPVSSFLFLFFFSYFFFIWQKSSYNLLSLYRCCLAINFPIFLFLIMILLLSLFVVTKYFVFYLDLFHLLLLLLFVHRSFFSSLLYFGSVLHGRYEFRCLHLNLVK